MFMDIKKKLAALTIAATLSFGICAHAASEGPKLLPFLYTDSDEVIAMIDSIEKADLTTEKQIEEAFLSYCELEDSAKAKVTNYEKLHEFRNQIAKLYNPDAESKQGGTLIDRSQILIGVYCVNSQSWTDKHFQAIKDCNIDIITNGAYDTTFLDLCEKYGIKTYVNYLSHIGFSKGQMHEIIPLGTYTAQAETFVDHPAIVGMAICDEPHSWDYPHIELLRQEAQELFPDKLIYINLFPSGGPVHAYAAGSEDENYNPNYDYNDYIREYEETIETDYISYDLYSLGNDSTGVFNFLTAAASVGDISRNAGKDYWFIPQVSSALDDVWVTTQQLRYQVYNSMVFGVKAINWACWNAGWWHPNNQVVDSQGNFTQQYEKLQTINHEIKTMSPIYMRYTSKDASIESIFQTYMLFNQDNFIFKHMDNVLEQNVITDITTTKSSTLIVGYFEKNIGEGTAFMFSNATDNYCGEEYGGQEFYGECQDAKVTFKLSDPKAELTAYIKDTAYKLYPDENGVYSISVPNGEGIFVTVNPITE